MNKFEMEKNKEKMLEEKERWLMSWKNNPRYKDVDMEVLKFIANISFFQNTLGTQTDAIYNLFSSGYCYYFANMLKSAFHRGMVCWVVNRGHIVWLDGIDLKYDIAYDIGGVFEDYEELRPVEYLGTTICNFIHNGEEWKSSIPEFEEYCNKKGTSEICEVAEIWRQIPKEILQTYDETKFTLPEVVIDYWQNDRKKNHGI